MEVGKFVKAIRRRREYDSGVPDGATKLALDQSCRRTRSSTVRNCHSRSVKCEARSIAFVLKIAPTALDARVELSNKSGVKVNGRVDDDVVSSPLR